MNASADSADDALFRLHAVQAKYPQRIFNGADGVWQYRDTRGGDSMQLPVLMLAGIQGGGDMFFEVAHALGDNYRLIMVSPPDITRVAAMTRSTAQFLDALRIDQVDLLGSSLGAYLAQDFAGTFAARVRQMILANGFFDPAPFLAKAPPAAAIESADAAQLVTQNLKSLLDQSNDDPGVARLQAVVKALVGPVQTFDNYKSRLLLLTSAPALGRPTIADAHIMLIDNDNDPIILPEMRTALRARFATAELHPIDGGGHLPAIQRPDEFNVFVRARLASPVVS